jgi:hypothetical protein
MGHCKRRPSVSASLDLLIYSSFLLLLQAISFSYSRWSRGTIRHRYISETIWQKLNRELAVFENIEYDWVTRCMWKKLNDDIEQRRRRYLEL